MSEHTPGDVNLTYTADLMDTAERALGVQIRKAERLEADLATAQEQIKQLVEACEQLVNSWPYPTGGDYTKITIALQAVQGVGDE